MAHCEGHYLFFPKINLSSIFAIFSASFYKEFFFATQKHREKRQTPNSLFFLLSNLMFKYNSTYLKEQLKFSRVKSPGHCAVELNSVQWHKVSPVLIRSIGARVKRERELETLKV